jgi:putative copper export protein
MAWVTLGLIGVTGLSYLYLSGTLELSLFLRPYGWLIGAKMFLFLLLVVNGLIMTIGIRPRMQAPLPAKATEVELKAKQADMMSAVRTLNRLIRLNLIIAGLALIIGAALPFGDLLFGGS